MGLETGTYIDDLVGTNPVGASDPKSQGDDHIRLLKNVLLNTFSGVDGEVPFTAAQFNDLALKSAASQIISATWTFSANQNFDNAAQINWKDSGAVTRLVIVWTAGDVFIVGNTNADLNLIGGSTTLVVDDNGASIDSLELGWRELPQQAKDIDYTCVIGDNGKHIYKAAGGAGETITIPANASVAYPLGATLTFINQGGGALSIAITTDTMTMSSDSTTGTRTLADDGIATAVKVTSTSWLINGTGLT